MIIDLQQRPECLAPLALWHHQQWQTLNPGQSLDDRLAKMQAYLSDQPIPRTFVWLNGEQLQGSAAIVDNDMDSHPELGPWLASVYVAPEFRQQGRASALVREVMRYAQGLGMSKLYLFTPDQQDFYHRLGWRLLSREYYRGHEVSLMVMEWQD